MQVRATASGFYDGVRKPGEVFEVADGVRGSWFEPADGAGFTPPAPRAKRGRKAEQPVVSDGMVVMGEPADPPSPGDLV